MQKKEVHALEMVKNYMWWAMGAGLVPFPLLDIAAVTAVQVKMLHNLSEHYALQFSENRGKSVVASLIGSVTANSVARGSLGSLIKAVPVVGTYIGALSMSIFSGATTYAVGKVFIQHFEAGGTILDFDPASVKEYFRDQFEEGKIAVENLKKEKGKSGQKSKD